MSLDFPTPAHSPQDLVSPVASAQRHPKSQRVLACVLCQQRKVRCDRKFPCANCNKAGVQCVSAALAPRQRRRRFPERDLLERLRHYEDLLRQNDIPFEPLHASDAAQKISREGQLPGSAVDAPTTTSIDGSSDFGAGESSTTYKAKSFWHAINRKSQIPANDDNEVEYDDNEADDSDASSVYMLRQTDIKQAWDTLYYSNDLLFCSRNLDVHISALHPSQIEILKLWQVYLQNIDPLLKITHTPTLQASIINAASDITNIKPAFEALMFGIYSTSIFSLTKNDCLDMFGSSREDLLKRYQLGAREALLNSGFLKSGDRDCLTALHLYLITVKPATDPRALSSMLAGAIRVAQRMGIDDEATNSRHSSLEAELRRRLWWSLVLFDARITEMTEFKTGLLLPTWDCRPPCNVNDFALRSESKNPPQIQGITTEAIFAVVRGESGDFIRHSSFHLDFINPALKAIARSSGTNAGGNPNIDELDTFESVIEEKYLRHCDAQIPLQFMTIWWARGQVAKSRFIRNLAETAKTTISQTEALRDRGISYALTMLECDSKLMSSELTAGFKWLLYLNFPFPAYLHIVQDLRKRPFWEHANRCWQAMGENCAARLLDHDNTNNATNNPMDTKDNPFFKIFAGIVMQAWVARKAATSHMSSREQPDPPFIVTQILLRMEAKRQQEKLERSSGNAELDGMDPGMPMGMDYNPSFTMQGQMDLTSTGLEPYAMLQAPPLMSFDVTPFGWPADWDAVAGNAW